MAEGDRDYLQTADQWTRFLASLIHELRTPITSLLILSDLLAEELRGNLLGQGSDKPKGLDTGEDKGYTEYLNEVVQDLRLLLGETADLAQLLAGECPLRGEVVSLAQLLREVEETARPWAQERSITLTRGVHPEAPRRVVTDPRRLRQTLALLLAPAIRHAREEVRLEAGPCSGGVSLVVACDGPELAADHLPRLFHPFHGSIPSGRRRGGRSVGLTVAWELARALGGGLRAENRNGRPTFRLSLPVRLLHPARPEDS
jgi:signal transduction histidine kinase